MERKDIILVLLESNKKPIVGTTRLQKLLFLIEKEKKVIPEVEEFDFEPYKFGPASKELYDDLDFLENIGFLTKAKNNEVLKDLDIDKIEEYNANLFLSSDVSTNESFIDYNDIDENKINDSIVYKITDAGIDYLNKNNFLSGDDHDKIQEVSKRFNNYSITSLLQYVYRKFPEYTSESEIKDDIL